MQRKSFLSESVRIVLPIVVIAAGVGSFLVFGSRPTPAPRESQEDAARAKTMKVAPHTGTLVIEVDGVVAPFREVTVAAEVSGRIEEKNPLCRAGKYVTGNTPLITINDHDYQLEKLRLEKELEQAERMLAETKEELDSNKHLIELANDLVNIKQKKLNRVVSLLPTQASSPSELDAAQEALITAKNTLQNLKNQQRLLGVRVLRMAAAKEIVAAKLDKAKKDIERSEIFAPFTGMIIQSDPEEGSYVQVGSALFTIEDTSKVEVKCSLQMEELAWILEQSPVASVTHKPENAYQLPDTPVEVVYNLNGREFIWKGVLSRYDGLGIDAKTRTVPCLVRVDDPLAVNVTPGSAEEEKPKSPGAGTPKGPQALVRGMFVTVRILVQPETTLLRLPEQAVKPGNTVWILREGKVDIVSVNVVQVQNGEALATASPELSTEDRVITSPLPYVYEAMPVREESSQ